MSVSDISLETKNEYLGEELKIDPPENPNSSEPYPAELIINQSGYSNVEGLTLNTNSSGTEDGSTSGEYVDKLEQSSTTTTIVSESEVVENEKADSIVNTENEQKTTINQVVSVTTTWSIWNPWTWLSAGANAIEEIESTMFKCIKAPIERFYVNIHNNKSKIWTLAANTESKNIPIVLVHGFCGGIALWLHNIDPLSESRPFYAFDLLGFGRSSRPNFSSDPIVAETQFVESIEDWRKSLDLNEIILLGHSFGGYLATSYSIKYPKHVKALILADPWGFPEIPTAKPDTPMPLWVKAIARISKYVSPLSVFRVTGQIGVTIFKYLRPDFKKKFMTLLNDPEIVYSYLYYANIAHPSGEAGFRAIAEYFGFAKNPMIRRIDKVENNIPIWFVYGARSWVDSSSGFASIHLRPNSTSVKLIVGAGHHVYADKSEEFNEYVKYIFELIEEHSTQRANNENYVTSDYYSNGTSVSN